MMPATLYGPKAIWASRDILRHPCRAALLFICLMSLVFLLSTALLFSQSMDDTWKRLMDQAPDLVIRRIDAGGWVPIPSDEAVALAKKVPGVLSPTPRWWGVVPGPDGPVTVMASSPLAIIPEKARNGLSPPSAGQAIVGQGVARSVSGKQLILGSRKTITVEIIDTFEPDTGLATHDLVWVTPDDARQVLGLEPGQASDLVVYVFHREEEQAIQTDLVKAFPWPVRITDLSTTAFTHHARAIRTGGIAVITCIPAILALVLIVTGTAVNSAGQMAHWGLLKSLGWTTADIVRLQVAKAVILGVPAITLGLALAYAVIFYPPTAGITAAWLTGGQHLPALTLSSNGAGLVMLEIAALVGLPYLAAVFLTTVRGATSDPWLMLQADPWN